MIHTAIGQNLSSNKQIQDSLELVHILPALLLLLDVLFEGTGLNNSHYSQDA